MPAPKERATVLIDFSCKTAIIFPAREGFLKSAKVVRLGKYMNIFQGLKNYLVETRVELKKVSWPSRQETTRYVIMVIIFSLLVALILGLFDFIFLELVGKLLLK